MRAYAVASVLLAMACSPAVEERDSEIAPPSGMQEIGSFEGTIEDGKLTIEVTPRPGLSDGKSPRYAVGPQPVVADGVAGSGPANTWEMVTTNIQNNVANGCGSGIASINANVTVRHFYPTTKQDVFAYISFFDPTSAGPGCNSDSNTFNINPKLGLWSYGTVAPGAAVTKTWKIRYNTGATFRFGGRLLARETCTGGQVSCNGTCVDLQTNADHCGACDHSCLGKACGSGICAAEDISSTRNQSPASIALDGDNIYWMGGTSTGLLRISKSNLGGAAQTVTGAFNCSARDILVDSGKVYIACSSNGALWSVPKTGTNNPRTLEMSASGTHRIQRLGSYLYVAAGMQLHRRLDGTTTWQSSPQIGSGVRINDFSWDGSFIYASNEWKGNPIARIPFDLSSWTNNYYASSTPAGSAFGLLATDDYIFFTRYTDGYVNSVRRITKSPPGSETQILQTVGPTLNIVRHGDYIYFASIGGIQPVGLYRLPYYGGSLLRLSVQSGMRFAFDDKYVYVAPTEDNPGVPYRVAK